MAKTAARRKWWFWSRRMVPTPVSYTHLVKGGRTRLLPASAILPAMENRSFSDVGGTPGGLGHFVMGFAMACIGGYLLVNQVTVMGLSLIHI